jgi:hypothetical protein
MYMIFYRIRYSVYLARQRQKKSDINAKVTIGNIRYLLSVKPGNHGLEEDVLTSGIREYPNVTYFRKFLENHPGYLKTYIGCGANIGYYAILTSIIVSRMKRGVAMYALEPVSATYARLLSNLKLNEALQTSGP